MVRAAARGAIAAMAMTGMRRVTTGLGLLRQTPPELVAAEGAPRAFARVPDEHRDEAIEIAHWLFGAAAGATYGALPRGVRRAWWGGPAYGLAIWAGFEAVAAPLLGVGGAPTRRAADRVSVAVDHVLYGLILAARPRGV